MTYNKKVTVTLVATYNDEGECIGVHMPQDWQQFMTHVEQAGSDEA